MDSNCPSKLHGTIKLPDFIPFRAFLATSSAFIAPDDAAIILVSPGLFLLSVIRVGSFSEIETLLISTQQTCDQSLTTLVLLEANKNMDQG